MADAAWIAEYEAENQEILDALAAKAAATEPKVWPISGADGDEWPEDAWIKFRVEV